MALSQACFVDDGNEDLTPISIGATVVTVREDDNEDSNDDDDNDDEDENLVLEAVIIFMVFVTMATGAVCISIAVASMKMEELQDTILALTVAAETESGLAAAARAFLWVRLMSRSSRDPDSATRTSLA